MGAEGEFSLSIQLAEAVALINKARQGIDVFSRVPPGLRALAEEAVQALIVELSQEYPPEIRSDEHALDVSLLISLAFGGRAVRGRADEFERAHGGLGGECFWAVLDHQRDLINLRVLEHRARKGGARVNGETDY